MGLKMKCKRLNGGSSPLKEQHYKSHRIVERQHVLRKLERIYKRLYKASLKAEKAGKARSSFFHKKFPKLEIYLKTITLKKVVGNE